MHFLFSSLVNCPPRHCTRAKPGWVASFISSSTPSLQPFLSHYWVKFFINRLFATLSYHLKDVQLKKALNSYFEDADTLILCYMSNKNQVTWTYFYEMSNSSCKEAKYCKNLAYERKWINNIRENESCCMYRIYVQKITTIWNLNTAIWYHCLVQLNSINLFIVTPELTNDIETGHNWLVLKACVTAW